MSREWRFGECMEIRVAQTGDTGSDAQVRRHLLRGNFTARRMRRIHADRTTLRQGIVSTLSMVIVPPPSFSGVP